MIDECRFSANPGPVPGFVVFPPNKNGNFFNPVSLPAPFKTTDV
jgi:hypothetical protein